MGNLEILVRKVCPVYKDLLDKQVPPGHQALQEIRLCQLNPLDWVTALRVPQVLPVPWVRLDCRVNEEQQETGDPREPWACQEHPDNRGHQGKLVNRESREDLEMTENLADRYRSCI